eukprot:gb/GEZN01011355.1/.p1 GENE.gb/GEZN01011355.1/~~gb/GEZN01011355.1/.p1  ORF type:complete len:357 (-),score=0.29 gb/GEZN01011355.1/:6-1076(-)
MPDFYSPASLLLLLLFGLLFPHSYAQHWEFLWSPPLLLPNWWEPYQDGPAPPSIPCDRRSNFLPHAGGCAGQLNNHLLCVTSNMERAMRSIDGIWVMSPGSTSFFSHFDFRAALSPWLCVATLEEAHNPPTENDKQYWDQNRNTYFNHLRHSTILNAVYRRPQVELKRMLHNFSLFHTKYVGIHLRALDDHCIQHMENACGSFTPADLQISFNFSNNYKAICDTSDEYVDTILASLNGLGLPFYVAHDSQRKSLDRLEKLRRRYNVTTQPPGMPGMLSMLFDQLMLINSHIFIGNPASTFTGTVSGVRYIMFSENNRQPQFFTNIIWPGGCAGLGLRNQKGYYKRERSELKPPRIE